MPKHIFSASMHHNQDGRVIPPAHLLPLDLPPHGPVKVKKKKKKRRSQSHESTLPPTRGYAAPVNPPQGGSAGRDRTAPHQPGGAGDAGPGSAGSRERSPHRGGGGIPPTPKPRDRSPAGQQGGRAQSMKIGKRRTEEEQR